MGEFFLASAIHSSFKIKHACARPFLVGGGIPCGSCRHWPGLSCSRGFCRLVSFKRPFLTRARYRPSAGSATSCVHNMSESSSIPRDLGRWLGLGRSSTRTLSALTRHRSPRPQIACMSALSGIVAVQLKDASGTCLLNLDGDVCTFCYVTTGVSLLIAGGVCVALLMVDYTLIKPLHDVIVGSSLFLAFWQFTMSLTIQIRGDQATDAGYTGTGARKAAFGMAWTSMACSLIMAGVTCLLMWLSRPKRRKPTRSGQAVPNAAVPPTISGRCR